MKNRLVWISNRFVLVLVEVANKKKESQTVNIFLLT